MIVVDSSVWIANLRRQNTEAVHRLFGYLDSPHEILVGDVVLLEVLQGARDDAHAAKIERSLRRFRVEAMLDPVLATIGARNYRSLRTAGVTVRKTIDLIIATFCIERRHLLLHDDRDFDAMTALGLRAA